MIAITFALPVESSGVVGELRERKDENGIIYGKLATHEVAIFHTGVGRKACERNIGQFLDIVQPKVLISAGFAGGNRAGLTVGNSIVGVNFSDPELVERIFPGATTRLFTAPSIIDSVEKRNRIARETGADAVDMETEVIASACASRRIRMLSVRTLSDTPEEPFPLPPSTLFDISRQRTNVVRLFCYLVAHPGAIAPLIRFSHQIKRAQAGVQNGVAMVLVECCTKAVKEYLDL